MPKDLKRFYHNGDLHFITCRCYQRHRWLNSARRRDLFLHILEQTRVRYRFVVLGYVVMPEHFHLLISEPEIGDPSTVMQVLKQRYAQRILRRKRRKNAAQGVLFDAEPIHVWQARFYDFNVWTKRKRIEKLRYMHRNPVKRGLVASPDQWRWTSFRSYMLGEQGMVGVNLQGWELKIKDCPTQSFVTAAEVAGVPPGILTMQAPAPCKERKERGTPGARE